MPRSHWKSIPIQIGLTGEALHKLRRAVLDLEDSVPHDGVLKHSHLVHWATYYLLVADREDVIRILKAGKASQEVHETRAETGMAKKTVSKSSPQAEVKAETEESVPPESVPQEPQKEAESSPVSKTTATVWTRGKKTGKSDTQRLDGERPAGRKVRKSPRRK